MAPYTPMSFEEFKTQYLRPSASPIAGQLVMSFEEFKAQSSMTSAQSMVSRPPWYYDSAHKAYQPATVLPSPTNSDVISWPSLAILPSLNTLPSLPSNTSSPAIMQPPNDGSANFNSPRKEKQKKNKRVPFDYWRETSPEASPPIHATFDSAQGRGWANAPAYPTTSQDYPVHSYPQPPRNHGNRQQPGSGSSGASATRKSGAKNLAHMMQNVSLGQQVEIIQRYD
jgi:hypothetical protein